LHDVGIKALDHPSLRKSDELAKSSITSGDNALKGTNQFYPLRPTNDAAWIVTHVTIILVLRTLGMFRRSHKQIPLKRGRLVFVHHPDRLPKTNLSESLTTYIRSRMAVAADDWPSDASVYGFSSRSTNNNVSFGPMRWRTYRDVLTPTIAGHATLDREATFRDCFLSASRSFAAAKAIRDSCRRSDSRFAGAEGLFLASFLQRRLNWKALYLAQVSEAGAAEFARQIRPIAAIQADGISKNVLGWTRSFRAAGIPVIYLADRILSSARLSNTPLLTESFDVCNFDVPSHYIVFDRISLQTLLDKHVPLHRIFFVQRFPSQSAKNESTSIPTCLNLYLQDYKDGMLKSMTSAFAAAKEAQLNHVHVRCHPNFPISRDSRDLLSTVGWDGLGVSFDLPSPACGLAASLSAYSTALIADALAGQSVIWLTFASTNFLYGEEFAQHIGQQADNKEELVQLVLDSARRYCTVGPSSVVSLPSVLLPPPDCQVLPFSQILANIA
jgi:hypothetical protein